MNNSDLHAKAFMEKIGIDTSPDSFTPEDLLEMLESEKALPENEQDLEYTEMLKEALEHCEAQKLETIDLEVFESMNRSCCFFGHREVYEKADDKLLEVVESLASKGVVDFYVGENGDFDRLAAGVVRKVKERYPEINLILVIPYHSTVKNENKKLYEDCYDAIILPSVCVESHYKAAITKRNRWMVSNCRYVVCYIRKSFGGAYETVKFAKKQNKEVIEI